MLKSELPDILYHFNFINIDVSLLEKSLYNKFFEKIDREIINSDIKRLSNLDIEKRSCYKKLKLCKNGIYLDTSKILSKIKFRYSLDILDYETINDAIKRLETSETLDDFCTNFPHLAYQLELNNEIEKEIRKVKNRKLKRLKNLNPNSKEYEQISESINKLNKENKTLILDAKKRVLKKLKPIHLNNLELLLNCSRNNFDKFNEISDTIMSLIDADKLALFVALMVKSYAELEDKNSNKYRAFMNYLKHYLNINKDLLDKDYTISIEYNNSLGLSGLTRYKMSSIKEFILKEEINHKEEQKKEFAKPEEFSFFGCDNEQKSREVLKHYYRICDSKIDENKKRILKEKLDYYSNLKFNKLYIGQNSFEGYLGFQLNDEIIVMDKFYSKKGSKKLSTEEAAVYIINIEEFEKLRELSRSQCIEKIKSDELKAERIFHNIGWQDKVNNKAIVLTKKM